MRLSVLPVKVRVTGQGSGLGSGSGSGTHHALKRLTTAKLGARLGGPSARVLPLGGATPCALHALHVLLGEGVDVVRSQASGGGRRSDDLPPHREAEGAAPDVLRREWELGESFVKYVPRDQVDLGLGL